MLIMIGVHNLKVFIALDKSGDQKVIFFFSFLLLLEDALYH